MSGFTTIADACELVTDGTHYTPKDVGTGFPFLTVKDVSDSDLDFNRCSFISADDYLAAKAGNSAPQKGDILFSKDGTVGKVHVVSTDQPFAVLSSLAILRPKAGKVDSGFLGHVLRSPAVLDDALKKKTGSAIRRIVLGDLKRVQLPLPSVEEQRRIAAILDQADALRAKRRETLAQLDRLTQAIFVEMFGGAEQILDNWPVKVLGDSLAFLTSGSRGWATYYAEAGDIFLRIQNVRRDELSLEDVAFVKAPDTAEAKRTLVQPGDVLLSITADLGRTAVVPDDIGVAFINQHLSILRTKALVPRFLSAYLASPGGQRQILGRNKHAVKAGLNFEDIRSFQVPHPPLALQQSFTARVQAVESLKASHCTTQSALDALFVSLQNKAFRGDL